MARVSIYLQPDEGSWGFHIRRGLKSPCRWNDLKIDEKEKVLRHIRMILTMLENED